MTDQERIDGLLRHIALVRENCGIMAEKLIAKGNSELGRRLIQVSLLHDNSKLNGIEWTFLTESNITNKAGLKYAIEHHGKTNPHHVEFWGAIDQMPVVYIAELVADLKARSAEFGTDLREYINNVFIKKYKIVKDGDDYNKIMGFVDMLCNKPFDTLEPQIDSDSTVMI